MIENNYWPNTNELGYNCTFGNSSNGGTITTASHLNSHQAYSTIQQSLARNDNLLLSSYESTLASSSSSSSANLAYGSPVYSCSYYSNQATANNSNATYGNNNNNNSQDFYKDLGFSASSYIYNNNPSINLKNSNKTNSTVNKKEKTNKQQQQQQQQKQQQKESQMNIKKRKYQIDNNDSDMFGIASDTLGVLSYVHDANASFCSSSSSNSSSCSVNSCTSSSSNNAKNGKQRKFSPRQRQVANQRERDRTHSVNSVFLQLRSLIPTEPLDRKLSKIETLRLAGSYINHLHSILTVPEELSDEPCLNKQRLNGKQNNLTVCTFCLGERKTLPSDCSITSSPNMSSSSLSSSSSSVSSSPYQKSNKPFVNNPSNNNNNNSAKTSSNKKNTNKKKSNLNLNLDGAV